MSLNSHPEPVSAEAFAQLADVLREELKQYGEMLARLEMQRDLVIRRQSNDLIQCVAEVSAQVDVIHVVRRMREQCRRDLAVALGLGADAKFSELAPLLPIQYRMLVEALVRENNELLVRIKQRTQENHVMFIRAVEMMQRFLNSSSLPEPVTDHLAARSRAPQHSMFEVIG